MYLTPPDWVNQFNPREKKTKMADSKRQEVVLSRSLPARLVRWRVVAGSEVREGSVLCFYEVIGEAGSTKPFLIQPKLKSAFTGKVRKLLFAEGDIVPARLDDLHVGDGGQRSSHNLNLCKMSIIINRLMEVTFFRVGFYDSLTYIFRTAVVLI